MKIIIAGAGEVGSHLAKMLSNEEQDITVIDDNELKLDPLADYNLMTQQCNATSINSLEALGIDKVDLFIAVTPHETTNLIACSMAKRLGAKKCVARIDNYEYMYGDSREFFRIMGIDDLIYPEYLAAREIATALKHTWVRNWFELFDGELIVAAVKLRDNSELVGKPLSQVGAIHNFMHVSAIKRYRETIIPGGSDVLHAGDIVYVATTHEHVQQVIDMCGKRPVKVDKLMIMGGSPIGIQLARRLQDKMTIKIIEKDYDRCQLLAAKLPECNIVHGDATDTALLHEEGIADYDAFAALTSSSEANILSCLIAKDQGVRKTIAEVESMQFISQAESLNIGTIINKKLLASSNIFQILLDSDVNNSRCLALADAEVAELILPEGSKACKAPVKNLRFPDGMTIAGVVRNYEGMLVKGDTQLLPGDHVVVFCLSGVFHKVEKYFG